MSGRGRVAVLTPYFPFFDGIFPDEYRRTQERNAKGLVDCLIAAGFSVAHLGLTDSAAMATSHGRELLAGDPDAVVVAPVMAAPATHCLGAVELLDRPTVLCQVVRRETFGVAYTEIDATEGSTLLGCIMAASGFRGSKRRFAQAVLEEGGPIEGLARVLDGAVAARRLGRSRMGILGGTLEGYVDVEVSTDELAKLGVEAVPIEASELLGEYRSVGRDAVQAAREGLCTQGATIDVGLAALERDLKLAVAFEVLVQKYSLDALVLNCHGPVMRKSQEIGIPACLAGSVVASGGRPVTCTGDVSTAVALLVAHQFTEKVLYCEPYTFEYGTGHLVLGSCGLGNLAAVGAPEATVCANEAYVGAVASGSCLRFGLAEGEATMLAVASYRAEEDLPTKLLWTTGRLTGAYFAHMHGPNAVLALDGDASRILEKWVRAGPAHHVALAVQDLSVELEAMSAFTALGMERVE